MRRCLTVFVAAGALVAAAPAAGDGGPPQNAVQGWDGATRGALRYVAVPTPDGWTTLQVIRRQGGRVMQWLNLKGNWGIPSVAPDARNEAVVADDRTIVLADIAYTASLRKHSSFLLVDTKNLSTVAKITLAGHFVFDALSPDARYLYLTEHTSPQNYYEYRVRAYDLRAGRLLSEIVADRTSWETTMAGWPISRVDRGGWAFTLYATGGGRPFIHALDTRHASAVCISLPRKEPQGIYDYRLRFDGDGHLVVRGPKGHTLFTLTRDFST